MKYILIFISIITLGSCASKLPFNNLDEIEAKTINLRTENRFFIPKEQYNPIPIRVNFIYLLDENGKGNFDGKNKDDVKLYDTIFKKANHLLANLVDPKKPECYKGDDFIKDTKIRFDFKRFYVKDSFARNYRNSEKFNAKRPTYAAFSPSEKWYIKPLDDTINDTISKKGINTYFNMDAKAYNDVVYKNCEEAYLNTVKAAVSQFPSNTNFTRSSQMSYPDKFTKRTWMENIYSVKNNRSWDKEVSHWFINSYVGITHELGHSFGLSHSNKHMKLHTCHNAIMTQGYKATKNYIQPTEIGKMHKAIMTTNLIQFIDNNANYNVPKIISKNENWDFKTIRFYQDIIVEEGNILILNGNVIFPANASILLKKDAVLVLNKAELKTANNKPFTNIIKHKHAKIIKY